MTTESLTLYDISPGRKIGGRYTVVGPHRQGGFSTAFEVTEDATGERCELQLYPSGLFEGVDEQKEFQQKLTPWTKIDSDHVLRVREILTFGASDMALVTDFPGGESLRERLNRDTRMTPDEVVLVGIQILDGLEKIHDLSLAHGDIKPYTIHLSGTGASVQAMLVDGGVTSGLWNAKDLGEKTALIGTPYYAPVEQYGGDEPDIRSDVYNVATVLFECVAGVLPWPGKTFLEVFQAKLQDPPLIKERAPGVEVDAALERAIRKGAFADRNLRYGSAGDFREALEGLR